MLGVDKRIFKHPLEEEDVQRLILFEEQIVKNTSDEGPLAGLVQLYSVS